MTLSLSWALREPPLAPCAVLAIGDAALALAERLLAEPVAARQALASPAGGPPRLFVVGDALPWVDGVQWLGVDPDAKGLYLPTTQLPSPPPALLADAVRRTTGLPAVVVPGQIVAAVRLAPLERHRLAAWRSAA